MNKSATIFISVKELTPAHLDRAHDWLTELEEELRSDGLRAWANTLRGFVRGLWAAKLISVNSMNAFEKLLKENGCI